MANVLHIIASPRSESYSLRVADALLNLYRELRPGDVIERFGSVQGGDSRVFRAAGQGKIRGSGRSNT